MRKGFGRYKLPFISVLRIVTPDMLSRLAVPADLSGKCKTGASDPLPVSSTFVSAFKRQRPTAAEPDTTHNTSALCSSANRKRFRIHLSEHRALLLEEFYSKVDLTRC